VNKGMLRLILSFLLAIISVAELNAQKANNDPFIWLENTTDSKSIDWVKAHDDATMRVFGKDRNFLNFKSEILNILNSKDRIPYGYNEGGYVYNFWQDDAHIKGILRRVTLEEYLKKDPAWEIVLDFDKLSSDEGKDYVFYGSTNLPPDKARGMIALSIGGGDAVEYREFDYITKTFVKDGFYLPEAKSNVCWYDINTLLIGTDFGPGSMTSSSYPRIAKIWKRGTPIEQAKLLFDGEISDVAAGAYVNFRPEGNNCFYYRNTDFWNTTVWLADSSGEKIELPFPKDSETYSFKGRMLALLHSDWMGIPEARWWL